MVFRSASVLVSKLANSNGILVVGYSANFVNGAYKYLPSRKVSP